MTSEIQVRTLDLSGVRAEIRPVAPDYRLTHVVTEDSWGCRLPWLCGVGFNLDLIVDLHRRVSAGVTRRN